MNDALVVGGGAVALATALALRRLRRCNRRAVPRLLEVARDVGGGGGGGRYYALGRRAVNFLRDVDAAPAASSMTAVRRFELRAGGVHLPLSAGGAPLCHIVAEEDLLDALRRRLRAAAVAVTACREVVWRGATKSAVCLAVDGEDYSAKLLVVADGGRTPLAAQMGVFGAAVDFRQQAVVAVVAAPLPPDTAAQWFDAHDVAALLPIGGGKFCLIWSTASPPPLAALGEHLSARLNLPDVRVVGDASVFPLRGFRRAARVAPRAAFVGDAAGVIHPLAGQGLNLGLRDAACLAACVRPHDAGAEEGLAAYAAVGGGRFSLLSAVTGGFARSGNLAKFALLAGKIPGVGRAAAFFANG